MKTITEYRPLIFSGLAARGAQATRARPPWATNLLVVVSYSTVGLWLSLDTGFAPWQWQFWLMFAPLFAAGELAWWQWVRREPRSSEE